MNLNGLRRIAQVWLNQMSQRGGPEGVVDLGHELTVECRRRVLKRKHAAETSGSSLAGGPASPLLCEKWDRLPSHHRYARCGGWHILSRLLRKGGIEYPLAMAANWLEIAHQIAESARASLALNRKRLREILAKKQRQQQESHSSTR